MTIGATLQRSYEQLRAISDAPSLDAERLLLHTLKQIEPAWLFTNTDQELLPVEASRFADFLQRRLTGEPLAYILGSAEFYGRPFHVSPAVLIPRPATEDLLDAALVAIRDLRQQLGRPLTIADIGTGSGCIAVTLALEAPSDHVTHIYATDISAETLAVAQDNARTHGVTNRITFRTGSLLEPVADIPLDLIVSNPPYIPSAEVDQAGQRSETLGLRFEPRQALDGGPDGQRYIAPLIATGLPLVLEVTSGRIRRLN